MQNQLILVIAALFFGFFLQAAVLWFFLRQAVDRLNPSRLQSQLQELLQRPLMDMTERVTRTHGELRHSLGESLNKHFMDTHERTERGMTQGRYEMQEGLLRTTQALEIKFQSLEQQVGLRLETIGKSVESKLNENLREGFKHFEKVQQHLQAAELKLASLNVVGQSISDLNNLLKLPHLRGGFGEATLERLLSDFLPLGSYELQYAITPGSTERVDAIVRLAKQVLPIDSKFPRDKIMPLFEQSQDPVALENARKSLSDFIRVQTKSIATKYIKPEHGTSEMALLFLPSETLYFEVIRNGELFEFMVKWKVFPISPNTLSISLKSISIAQEYYELAKGVEKTIEDVKKAHKHFEHFEKRFEDIGRGLKKAQEAFETANTHLNYYEGSVFKLTGDRPDRTIPDKITADKSAPEKTAMDEALFSAPPSPELL